MMSNEQLLLLKLAEECAEVAQRASKMMQFGGNEVQVGQELTNRDRLKRELYDLVTVIAMLEEEQIVIVPGVDFYAPDAQKINKIQKYKRYSQELGYVEGDRIA